MLAKYKNKLALTVTGALALVLFSGFGSGIAFATNALAGSGGPNVAFPSGGSGSQGGKGCQSNDSCQDPAVKCTKSQCDLVAKYVNPAINLLAAVFGAVAVISVIMGGIQYSTSEGDPQKSSKAKDRIQNTLLAVIAFIFLYAFLQFLVPGGLFNRSIG